MFDYPAENSSDLPQSLRYFADVHFWPSHLLKEGLERFVFRAARPAQFPAFRGSVFSSSKTPWSSFAIVDGAMSFAADIDSSELIVFPFFGRHHRRTLQALFFASFGSSMSAVVLSVSRF